MTISNNFFSTYHLTKKYGGIQALNSLDITIGQGEIHGIIGPNGAGKSTLINVISGLVKPNSGHIIYQGNRIDQLSAQLIFKAGISRTFQNGRIASGLTVLENVMVGLLDKQKREKVPKNIFHDFLREFSKKDQARKKGIEILKNFELLPLAEHWAEDLVWFERQLVQIARAVASRPQFLLLDEPTAGMGLDEKRMIEEKLIKMNQSGMTLMLVSHDMPFIRSIAQHITVLDFGQKISEGFSKEVLADPRVWEVYLGAE